MVTIDEAEDKGIPEVIKLIEEQRQLFEKENPGQDFSNTECFQFLKATHELRKQELQGVKIEDPKTLYYKLLYSLGGKGETPLSDEKLLQLIQFNDKMKEKNK